MATEPTPIENLAALLRRRAIEGQLNRAFRRRGWQLLTPQAQRHVVEDIDPEVVLTIGASTVVLTDRAPEGPHPSNTEYKRNDEGAIAITRLTRRLDKIAARVTAYREAQAIRTECVAHARIAFQSICPAEVPLNGAASMRPWYADWDPAPYPMYVYDGYETEVPNGWVTIKTELPPDATAAQLQTALANVPAVDISVFVGKGRHVAQALRLVVYRARMSAVDAATLVKTVWEIVCTTPNAR